MTGATHAATGRIEFQVANLTLGAGTFVVDLVTRVLNHAGNVQDHPLRHDLGAAVVAD